MIRLKRAYQAASPEDGYRILVERLWPRGITKARARLDLWLKDIAPSQDLRKWYNHDPAKWAEFQKRYRVELRANPAVAELRQVLDRRSVVTFVYGARDEEHNSARLLKDFIERDPRVGGEQR